MVVGDLELVMQVFKKGYEDLRSKGLKTGVCTTTSTSGFLFRLTSTIPL